jgi:Outer membrane protein beta-barrel domain
MQIGASLFAQFSIAPLVAANFSKSRTTQNDFETLPVLRYVLGVQPMYHFSEKTAVGLGMHLTTKGYKGKPDIYYVAGETNYQYLEINPFFEYRPFKFLGLQLGGEIGYNTLVEFKYGGSWITPSKLYKVKKWDAGLTGGARYYSGNFFVSLLYTHGIITFDEINFTDENGLPVFKLNQYHQTLSLGVGYNFQLKKK